MAGSSRSSVAFSQQEGLAGGRARSGSLCLFYVLLSASGPLLLDWVKRSHGGRFLFSVPALTFNAWALATTLCFTATMLTMGKSGLRRLNRPDMVWRFCIITGLFCAGDILGFMSMEHLDVGTFSLLGKSLAIICTLVFSRVLLRRRFTKLQYALVVVVVFATACFCREEQAAQRVLSGVAAGTQKPTAVLNWVGLVERTCAVALTSLGAVFQEFLLKKDPGLHIVVQQCWMGIGGMAMSLFTLRILHGLPLSSLLTGFNDWKVLVLLLMYVATGLTTNLVVRRLGATAKALCVPIYLGACYAYAVSRGDTILSWKVATAWSASTVCVLLFAVTSAARNRPRRHLEADLVQKADEENP